MRIFRPARHTKFWRVRVIYDPPNDTIFSHQKKPPKNDTQVAKIGHFQQNKKWMKRYEEHKKWAKSAKGTCILKKFYVTRSGGDDKVSYTSACKTCVLKDRWRICVIHYHKVHKEGSICVTVYMRSSRPCVFVLVPSELADSVMEMWTYMPATRTLTEVRKTSCLMTAVVDRCSFWLNEHIILHMVQQTTFGVHGTLCLDGYSWAAG